MIGTHPLHERRLSRRRAVNQLSQTALANELQDRLNSHGSYRVYDKNKKKQRRATDKRTKKKRETEVEVRLGLEKEHTQHASFVADANKRTTATVRGRKEKRQKKRSWRNRYINSTIVLVELVRALAAETSRDASPHASRENGRTSRREGVRSRVPCHGNAALRQEQTCASVADTAL